MPVDAPSAAARRVMSGRDRAEEDEVETLFEKTRSGLKIPHLGRIEFRDILQEQIMLKTRAGGLMPRGV